MGTLSRWAIVWTALAASAGAFGADPADRLVQGELVRVDVGKRTLVVRPVSQPPREVDVTVDAVTFITASGRNVGLEDLKTGERVVVACTGGSDGPCRARRVRAGPGRYAAPPAATR